MTATRLEPDHPLVQWTGLYRKDLRQKTDHFTQSWWLPAKRGVLRHIGTADYLGAAFYSGCSQHAANEHNLKPILREGLEVMAGLFWDIGDGTLQSEITRKYSAPSVYYIRR